MSGGARWRQPQPLYPHPQPSLRGCRLMQEAPGLLPSLKLPVKALPRQATRSDGGRQCVCTSCQHLAQQLESEGLCWSSAEGRLERDPQKQDLPSSWNAYSCRGHKSEKGKKRDHVCISPDRPSQSWGWGAGDMAPRGTETQFSVFSRTEQWGFDPGTPGEALRPKNAVGAF